jgi:hypothetical protein
MRGFSIIGSAARQPAKADATITLADWRAENPTPPSAGY